MKFQTIRNLTLAALAIALVIFSVLKKTSCDESQILIHGKCQKCSAYIDGCYKCITK